LVSRLALDAYGVREPKMSSKQSLELPRHIAASRQTCRRTSLSQGA
jgi:hypothetical protein